MAPASQGSPPPRPPPLLAPRGKPQAPGPGAKQGGWRRRGRSEAAPGTVPFPPSAAPEASQEQPLLLGAGSGIPSAYLQQQQQQQRHQLQRQQPFLFSAAQQGYADGLGDPSVLSTEHTGPCMGSRGARRCPGRTSFSPWAPSAPSFGPTNGAPGTYTHSAPPVAARGPPALTARGSILPSVSPLAQQGAEGPGPGPGAFQPGVPQRCHDGTGGSGECSPCGRSCSQGCELGAGGGGGRGEGSKDPLRSWLLVSPALQGPYSVPGQGGAKG